MREESKIELMILIAILFLIVVFGLGIAFGKAKGTKPSGRPEAPSEADEQKILEYTKSNGEIANADVQELLGVSAATAERYLEKLESQKKLIQKGTTGRNVIYEIR